MKNISLNPILQQSFINAIDKEELLLIKYEEYNKFIKDQETTELLKEFQEIARKHIDLLKDNLHKFDV